MMGKKSQPVGLSERMQDSSCPDWSERPVTVPYANLSDPQTLNLYNYVRNSPVARFDADGHFRTSAGSAASQPCSDGTNDCQDQQATSPPAQPQQQILDGSLHTTHNPDGTTSSYQGTVGTVQNKDEQGNVVSTTTTTTVTTQSLNAHGD